MIIKEQRGKVCPLGGTWLVGAVSCEECNHWKFKLAGRVNSYGMECADEYCTKLGVEKHDE